MKPKQIQTIFFGTETFSLPTLKELVRKQFSVQAVVTKPDARRGRRKKLVPPAVKTYAQKHGIPVLQPSSSEGLLSVIQSYDADIGVLVAYGKILPKAVLDHFEKGIINAHPSLLPKYRGPAPIEAAILHGDTKTGVSIIQITEAMDAGPVFTQEKMPLNGNETRPILYERLAEKSAEVLTENLANIYNQSLEASPQNDSNATYTNMIKKGDGDIDWNDTARINERKVRAYLGWPGSRAQIKKQELIVLEASIIEKQSMPGAMQKIAGFPVVGCEEDSLKLDRVKPPGKKAMSGDAFLRGYLKQ